jgi:glutathione S-transferase
LVELLNAKKAEDKGAAFLSEGGRLSTWLAHFERVLAKSGGPYLFGAEPNFADFALFQFFEVAFFPRKTEVDAITTEALRSWLEAVEARPSTVAYRALKMPNLPESVR